MSGWTRSRGGTSSLLALALACGALLLGLRAAHGVQESSDRRARTVVVVRHGEKDSGGDARDPSLSSAGTKRADALARLLSSASVTHLYATEFRRTQDTLAPLAKACGKTVSVVAAKDTAELVASIQKLPPGSVSVVAGHSNTVPLVVAGLARAVSAIADDEYDRLYVITLPPEGARDACDPSVVELRYGD